MGFKQDTMQSVITLALKKNLIGHIPQQQEGEMAALSFVMVHPHSATPSLVPEGAAPFLHPFSFFPFFFAILAFYLRGLCAGSISPAL